MGVAQTHPHGLATPTHTHPHRFPYIFLSPLLKKKEKKRIITSSHFLKKLKKVK